MKLVISHYATRKWRKFMGLDGYCMVATGAPVTRGWALGLYFIAQDTILSNKKRLNTVSWSIFICWIGRRNNFFRFFS
jgi:hypothetical protein